MPDDYKYGQKVLQEVTDEGDLGIIGQFLDYAFANGWEGMKGKRVNMPDLRRLFGFLPDSIDWTEGTTSYSYDKSYLGDIIQQAADWKLANPGGATGGGGGASPTDPTTPTTTPDIPDYMPPSVGPGVGSAANDRLTFELPDDDPRLGTAPPGVGDANPFSTTFPADATAGPTPLTVPYNGPEAAPPPVAPPAGPATTGAEGAGGEGVSGGNPFAGFDFSGTSSSTPGNPLDFLGPFEDFLDDQTTRKVWDAMAQSGFTGNRYGSSAQNRAARVGGETGLELGTVLSNLLFQTFNQSENRALQAALGAPALGLGLDSIFNNQLGALQGFGQFEQGRADDIAGLLFNNFQANQYGLLPLLLQLAQGQTPQTFGFPSAGEPGGFSQFTDLLGILAQILGLFDF